MSSSPQTAPRAYSKRRFFYEVLILCTVFAVVCFPLIFSNRDTNYVQDELNYHIPAIRQISEHWPVLDIARDSVSATAPGYHYALATLSKITGANIRSLRLVNWVVSASLIVMLFGFLRKSLSALESTLALLPLLFSNFFVKSASWVVTDNAALLLVALAFLLCLRSQNQPSWRFSLISTSAVFVRQMSVWLVMLPFVTAVGHPNEKVRKRFLLRACLFAIPALAVLSLLVWHWGGLVPPAWRTASLALSTAGLLYLISVLGVFAPFYCVSSISHAETRGYFSAHKRLFSAASAVTLLLWLSTVSDANAEQGRWGGYLWNLSNSFPSIANHNALFLILSQIGVFALVIIWLHLRHHDHAREAMLFLLSIVFWGATFVVNRQVFHRYFEPTILVLLISITPALIYSREAGTRSVLPLLFLGVAQLMITLATAHYAIIR